MGLDMYAYATKAKNLKRASGKEIAYWRKHNRLQGWMDALWSKRNPLTDKDKETIVNWGSCFNGQKLVLTLDDLLELEKAVITKTLPRTSGFFFGNDSYGWLGRDGNYEHFADDQKFIDEARKYIKAGYTVYYQCSW